MDQIQNECHAPEFFGAVVERNDEAFVVRTSAGAETADDVAFFSFLHVGLEAKLSEFSDYVVGQASFSYWILSASFAEP